MNVDLHSHSIASDGLLTGEEVAARAHAGGVDVWALTDHDEVGGLAGARAAAEHLGIRFIDGVEISVTWRPDAAHKGITIHMVGLKIDPANATLVAGLRRIRSGRDARAAAIARDLEIAGVDGALEGAKRYAINPELLSRTHFARFLVEAGKARNTHQAFGHFLTEGKPGYVAHQWATLPEAMSWIRAAGGTPVVAHPGRYKLSAEQLSRFFGEFKDLGGAAIEVMTGSHTPEQYNHFAEIARCYGFMASRGSDYHGPGESRVEPGMLPPLPSDLTPVWHDWF
jgi:predicted metal-dependent phosphoesterase TrpH